MSAKNESNYPYIYRWNRMGRKGENLKVLVRGKMNSCLVEFTDGFRAVTSRNAIKKVGQMSNLEGAEIQCQDTN